MNESIKGAWVRVGLPLLACAILALSLGCSGQDNKPQLLTSSGTPNENGNPGGNPGGGGSQPIDPGPGAGTIPPLLDPGDLPAPIPHMDDEPTPSQLLTTQDAWPATTAAERLTLLDREQAVYPTPAQLAAMRQLIPDNPTPPDPRGSP